MLCLVLSLHASLTLILSFSYVLTSLPPSSMMFGSSMSFLSSFLYWSLLFLPVSCYLFLTKETTSFPSSLGLVFFCLFCFVFSFCFLLFGWGGGGGGHVQSHINFICSQCLYIVYSWYIYIYIYIYIYNIINAYNFSDQYSFSDECIQLKRSSTGIEVYFYLITKSIVLPISPVASLSLLLLAVTLTSGQYSQGCTNALEDRPDPSSDSCQSFYRCYRRRQYSLRCPLGQVFDFDRSRCRWVKEIQCCG